MGGRGREREGEGHGRGEEMGREGGRQGQGESGEDGKENSAYSRLVPFTNHAHNPMTYNMRHFSSHYNPH